MPTIVNPNYAHHSVQCNCSSKVMLYCCPFWRTNHQVKVHLYSNIGTWELTVIYIIINEEGFIVCLLILLKLLTVFHIYICFTVLVKKGYIEELFIY